MHLVYYLRRAISCIVAYLGAGLGEPVPHEVLVDDRPPDVERHSRLQTVLGELDKITTEKQPS